MDLLKLPVIAASFCVVGLFPASADVRTFRIADGRTFDAEVVEVTSESVVLKYNGEELKLSPTQFSPDDKEYFRELLRQKDGIFDWPGARGIAEDGSTAEALGLEKFNVLWRANVGQGDAAVAIAGSHACTAGKRGGKMEVAVFDTKSGSLRWRKGYGVKAGDGRVVATPTIDLDEHRVYSVSPSGRIDCWELQDGENVWATALRVSYKDAEFPVGGFFGSPSIQRDKVFLEVGGPAYSLVALSKANGLEVWRIGKHRSLGATPVMGQVDQRRVIVCRNQHGVVGRDADSGAMVWDIAWEGAGRASPLILGRKQIFVTSEKACALIRVDGRLAEQVWTSDVLCSTTVTPVYHDGYLYGFNGEVLTCVRADSGEVAWTKKGLGGGNLIRAADRLLIQTGSSGELVVVDADPKKYHERSRTKVFDGKSETIPVLASGLIFCRSAAGDLTCLDARRKNVN